ncbi:MAG: universal stress protein [Methylophilaceae bacterium]|nr:universal stress protein [Methylophilaceae bacterium]
MNILAHILFATDFSERCLNAERRIGLLPKHDGSKLILLHVLSGSLMHELKRLLPNKQISSRLQESATQQLKAQAERLSANSELNICYRLEIGRPHSVVISEASINQSLIVIGAHGRHAVRDWFQGSMVERLLSEARQSLLVVKQTAQHSYQRVLVPVDFSSASLSAVRAAMTIALQAEITLLNVFQIPLESQMRFAGISDAELALYRASSKEKAGQDMQAFMAQIGDLSKVPFIKLEYGVAPEIILAQADDLACDLIVMGRHGKSDLGHFLLGSVTEYVSTQCECDVLVASEGN